MVNIERRQCKRFEPLKEKLECILRNELAAHSRLSGEVYLMSGRFPKAVQFLGQGKPYFLVEVRNIHSPKPLIQIKALPLFLSGENYCRYIEGGDRKYLKLAGRISEELTKELGKTYFVSS